MAQPTLLVRGSLRLEGETSHEIPVDYIVSWLQKRMPEFGGKSAQMADRVLVVRAETGSGKSTVLPVAVFRILRSSKAVAAERYHGPSVICTQPRVLTAIALANDVSSRPWNPDIVMSKTVGFQTGPVSAKPPSGLLFATAGVLAVQLRQESDDEIMNRYRFILVDEAHERTLDGDQTLMLLRSFYLRNEGNPRLPFLLLTSATFDTLRYAEYFGVGPKNIVEVVGRAYPITVHWPAHGTNDYTAEAADVALRIHEEHLDDKPDKSDILVFMPGTPEMTAVAERLQAALDRYQKNQTPPFLILSINREIIISQSGDYPLVFENPELLPSVNGARPLRRVILSTVVAETGLTLNTLRYVIDCGWSRTREVYQPWGVAGIITRPAPRSRIKQRQGRAGRMFPGDFYPLYAKNVYDALEEQQLPEVITVGVSEIYLSLVSEQQGQKLRTGKPPEFRVEDISLLDPPPPDAFLAANSLAVLLGFISSQALMPAKWPVPLRPEEAPLSPRGYGLTGMGHVAAQFSRTPMEAIRVILAGYVWKAAAQDLVTAVAMFGHSPSRLLNTRARPPKGLPLGAEALRASLPHFLLHRTGGGVVGVLPPAESEAFYYRARLLLSDDFAEAIFMFDAFAAKVDATQCDLAAVSAWCAGVGLNFEEMLELTRRRETVIEEMITAGLDPFRASERRLSVLSIESFTEGVRALKRCLYDGLRCRLLHWDAKEGAYMSAHGLRVLSPSLLTDETASRLRALRITQGPADTLRPRWIVTDALRFAPAPKRDNETKPPLLYTVETGLVSVLDGYVDPDPEFTTARFYD